MRHKAHGVKCNVRGSHAEMFIYEEIDPFWGIGAKQFADDLKSLGDVETINVRINSPGGDVFDGLAIYNQLKRHSAKVEVDVDGIAASISSIIALSGDTVRMASNAMLMIHDPWTVAVGNADELRKTVDTLDKIKDTLVGTYAGRSNLDAEFIAEMMGEETWLDAAEAVEAGFADEVTGQQAMAAKFDLSRFRNAPKVLNEPAEDEDAVPYRRMALQRKLEIMKRSL